MEFAKRKASTAQFLTTGLILKATIALRSIVLLFSFSFLFNPVTFAQSVEKVRIGLPGFTTQVIAFRIAQLKGIFNSEGLEAELVSLRSSVAMVALVNNELDYTSIVGLAVSGAASGLPVKGVMLLLKSPDHALIAKGEIRSLRDLRGRTVSFTAGDATETIVESMLGRANMTLKDVKVLPISGSGNRYAALIAGRTDAALLDVRYIGKAVTSGFNRLIDASEVYEGAFAGLTVSNERLQKSPQQIKRMMRALLKAQTFIQDNKEETMRILSSWINLDRSAGAVAYDSYIRGSTSNGWFSDQVVKFEIDRAREISKIKDEVPTSKVVDLRLLSEVLQELKLPHP